MAPRVLPMHETEPTTPVAGSAGCSRHADGAGVGGDNVVAPMHAVTDVYHSRELLWNLTLRELRTKYRRSFLGWAWSMLNPLSQILIYGFVFGTLLGGTAPVGVPSGLDNFALWLLCGLLPWNFFSLITALGLGCDFRELRTRTQSGVSARGAGVLERAARLRAVLDRDVTAADHPAARRQPIPSVAAARDSHVRSPRRVRNRYRHGTQRAGRLLPRRELPLGDRHPGLVLCDADRVFTDAPRGKGADLGVQHPQAQPDERLRRGVPTTALRRRSAWLAHYGRTRCHFICQSLRSAG